MAPARLLGPAALLAVIATLVALNGVALLQEPSLPPAYRHASGPLLVNGLFSAGAGLLAMFLLLDLGRRARDLAIAGGAATAIAAALGIALGGDWGPLAPGSGDPIAWLLAPALWLALVAPPVMAAALRAPRVLTATMVAALAAFVALAAPAMATGAPPEARAAGAAAGRLLAEGAALLALAAATGGLAAWTLHAAPAVAVAPRRFASPVVAWWIAGAFALLLVWLLQAFAVVLWVVPPLLFAAPALARVRPRAPWLAAIALLVAGYAPMVPCAAHDTWGGPPVPATASLLQAAVRGPQWADPGIDSMRVTTCGAAAFGAGLLVLGGLVALAAWPHLAPRLAPRLGAWRAPSHPPPPG